MATKAIQLESGEGLSATFVPGAGMIGISMKAEGQEFFGQRDGFEAYVESGKTMGLPLLYPWANRLARDSWEFAGRTVVLGSRTTGLRRDTNGFAIHGTLAASKLWRVEESATDPGLESAELRASLDFGEHPELLDSFPFPHLLEITITLKAMELTVTTTVTATGDVAVPLAFGFHPYIALPGTEREDWAIDLPEMTRIDADDRGIPNGETAPFAALTETLGADDWDQGFNNVVDGSVFAVADQNWMVGVKFESGYAAAQVYAPSGENLVCFEPMKAPTNALVTGTGLKSVEPGESDISRFSISVSKVGDGGAFTESGEHEQKGFRLERDAPVTEVRRVARERVQSALKSLRKTAPEDRTTAVHEARKDLKKMRSVLRLVRGDLDKKTYRAENRRFREAGRLLSDQRDNDVLLQTIEKLRDQYPDGADPLDELVGDLEARRDHELEQSAVQGSGGKLDEAARAIEAGGGLIDSWTLEKEDWELFEKGLRRTYRDGRKAMAEAEAQTTPENVHEWRKRVKDLWYQLRLLRNAWKATLKAQAKEAGDLAEMLGEYNDLAMLVGELNSRPATGGDFPELRRIAVARQAELLDEAFPLGHRIYAEEPGDFVARIGSYWRS